MGVWGGRQSQSRGGGGEREREREKEREAKEKKKERPSFRRVGAFRMSRAENNMLRSLCLEFLDRKLRVLSLRSDSVPGMKSKL
jgi:hypothetical protein